MKIRKFYEFESAHKVLRAVSERCRKNVHGHSYKVEIEISGEMQDNGMVVDFISLQEIKNFIDKLDHTLIFWGKDKDKEIYKRLNSRWIEFPFNVTAENIAILIISKGQEIVTKIRKDLKVTYVRVWETRTGSAIAKNKDIQKIKIKYSNDLRNI